MFIQKLRLTHGYRLFFSNYAIFLVPVFWVDILQIFNFHCKCEIVHIRVLIFGKAEEVDAGPHFSKSTWTKFFLALVLWIYILFGSIFRAHLLKHVHTLNNVFRWTNNMGLTFFSLLTDDTSRSHLVCIWSCVWPNWAPCSAIQGMRIAIMYLIIKHDARALNIITIQKFSALRHHLSRSVRSHLKRCLPSAEHIAFHFFASIWVVNWFGRLTAWSTTHKVVAGAKPGPMTLRVELRLIVVCTSGAFH